MNTKVLFGAGASVCAAIGAIVTFKPETVFNDNYSFFEYALSVLAVPLLALGACVLLLIVLLSLPGATLALTRVHGWKDLSPGALFRSIRTYRTLPLIVCLLALAFAGYQGARLAKTSYTFARDRLFPQYRSELLSRSALDLSDGNLYAAKRGYADIAERFKGTEIAAEASSRSLVIDRMLAIKSTIVDRARERDKIFGVNRTGLQWKVEALRIHPWDAALRADIQQDLNKAMKEYLPPFLADVQLCSAKDSMPLEKLRLGRHLTLLGFERAGDAGIKGARPQEWRDRLCELVGEVPKDRLSALIESIWQRAALEKIVGTTEPDALAAHRRVRLASMRQVESKWLWFLDRSSDSPEESVVTGDDAVDFSSVPLPPRMTKGDPVAR